MREKILAILLDNKGKYISGQEISEVVGVTRAAVWKHIKGLREEGYYIESATKKGYCLKKVPDILDPFLLTYGLNTNRFGKVVQVYDSINSTNIKAKTLAQEGWPEGTLVIADQQTGGRGRLDRKWASPAGKGAWMSIILKPDLLSPKDAPQITAMAALAVARCIYKLYGIKVDIKWPNDILVEGKKLCGILTEIQCDPDVIRYIIVGIGINVNIGLEEFSGGIRHMATSIGIEKGEYVNRNALIQGVMEELEELYLSYISSCDFAPILEEYKKWCITIGRRVRVIGTDMEFEGEAIDFTPEGHLIIKKDDGTLETVMSGDVSIRGLTDYV
ncbi:MAG: biotin--[acetyl-CoA-carboxylase] ligase [Xylanivirga thermophila]|jgi:BirA family transcriptional regulator, biotin operon repressor / biotin---[acetyl-CoA-carboxylase] ligase|uniref:biotin--[acetyl-CoA-carboxylase] ligase n=1 Tax=Xylanivirga thermophila TaxID=2496273 RepID=UPI00101B657C|nr:biotin--[acetyl-CoA-carboxylase] ligase [Xylanivirga thermophila]